MPIQDPAPPLHRLLGQTADAVAAVQQGRSLTVVLAETPAGLRAATQALSFLVLRRLGGAEAALALLAAKAPPLPVRALLLTALALLWPDAAPLPYAEHTLVDQAVRAAQARTPAAAKFVNAVLRRFLRERAAMVAQVQCQPEAVHNHPAWWVRQLQQDWPDQWQALLAQANSHPPMALRVNQRLTSVADYLGRLQAAGQPAVAVAAAAPGGPAPQAVLLARPCGVQALPGFAEGLVSVQDVSAQRAAPLLLDASGALPPLAPGARVLDACAAPGGKTAHLLELADLDLLALDSDARRLLKVQDTLTRLHLPAGPGRAVLQAADARDVSRWWGGQPFDAILLDAPCTASGIVRRHPDVRWLRRPADIPALAHIQQTLLDALWPLLKPGGRLLYATCSIFKAEGQQQIDAFLQRHGPAGARLHPASPGHLLCVPDNPTLPTGLATGDGFYLALLIAP